MYSSFRPLSFPGDTAVAFPLSQAWSSFLAIHLPHGLSQMFGSLSVSENRLGELPDDHPYPHYTVLSNLDEESTGSGFQVLITDVHY